MSDIKLACDMAEQIKTICDKHGNKPGELINILHEAQHLYRKCMVSSLSILSLP